MLSVSEKREMMSSNQIKRISLAEQLFDILREELQSGEYSPGQKLMSEGKMAEHYGVSRLTVRAAIARLSALGYVEAKNGEGIFVKELDKDSLLKTMSSLVVEPQMLDDVNAFRKLLETECVKLTIKNASNDSLAKLTQACNNFNNYLENIVMFDETTKKKIVDLDYEFHLKICELSGNTLYPIAYKAVQEALKQHIYTNFVSRWVYNRIDTDSDSIKRFTQGHINLLQAIKDRDQQAAKRITLSHINYGSMKIPND